eukprot:761946-Hanusia_phi.AAC.1
MDFSSDSRFLRTSDNSGSLPPCPLPSPTSARRASLLERRLLVQHRPGWRAERRAMGELLVPPLFLAPVALTRRCS